MKKALIEMELQFHTTEDFAKALQLIRLSLNDEVPLDPVSASYCVAVFRDVIDLLWFYNETCDACIDSDL